jgi:DNA-binding MarR family transcriptional regulator
MSKARRAELEETVTRAMRIQVVRAVVLNQTIAARAGINASDLQGLNLLTLDGPMTASRLADALAITKGGAITAMIDRLERGGYLRRTRDTADRRQVLLELVPGEPLRQLTGYFAPAGQALADILADYGDEQLQLIAEVTTRTNDTIAGLGVTGRATHTTRRAPARTGS